MLASATVPVEVIGEPPTSIPVPASIEVIVPDPAGAAHDASAPAPPVRRNSPATPGASPTQPAAVRVISVPRALVSTPSRNVDTDTGIGGAVEPVTFASIRSSAILASEI